MIVRFERGTTASERLGARRAADVTFERSLRLPRAQLVDVEDGVRAAIERLERQPGVAYAQPNYRYRALVVAPPNDTFYSSLWGLQDSLVPSPGVDALEAWETTRGAGQVIAVIDTGVALDHPDLQGNLWTGPGGVHGHDFVDDDADPDDYDFHGTHVAGTIAAIAGNGIGIAGVAPEAEIMAVRVLDGDGSGSSADIASGIAYAAQQGADVINLSLGGPAGVTGDQLMSNSIGVANTHGTIVVAAAGNDGANNDTTPTTPCTLSQPNLVCVAAVNQSGNRASFSNYGASTVDLGAPGTSILSAKTDYDVLVTESFASGLGNWTSSVANGGVAWGSHATGTDGSPSATDSPGGSYGNAVDETEFAESQLIRTGALDLVSQRGCRMHFDLKYDTEEDYDMLVAGAVAPAEPPFLPAAQDTMSFTGSNGSFTPTEVSISDLGGRSAVRPAFALFSDELINDDGAYVDNLRVLCRAATYADSASSSGNYVSFQGTSMATPHVAGVVALVRAAALDAGEDAGAGAVIEAVLDGVRPLPSLDGFTVTGGTADAGRAIAEVLGLEPPPDEPPDDGASAGDAGGTSGGTAGGTVGSSPPFLTPAPRSTAPRSTAPRPPNLSRAKSRIRVKRSRFRYRFRATPGLRGRAVFRTRKKARVGSPKSARRRHLTLARPRFTVGPRGVVRLRVRLSRKEMRILRRNRRLLLRVTVTVRNAAGQSAKATKRLRLVSPR